MIISALFDEVRIVLRDENENMYKDPMMVGYYNRAVYECWSLMNQIGGEIAMTDNTITTDGLAQSYVLPYNFSTFVPHSVLPRSPRTATADYTHSRYLDQISSNDLTMTGSPTITASPRRFAITLDGTSQFIKFDTLPPAGEYYDYRFYQTPQHITVGDIDGMSTPWYGMLDPLLARILEQLCREGLEFITSKRDLWRAKAENDIVELLGLRHLTDVNLTPSLWRGI